MTADSRYRAFISYSHADHARARRLHRALENYRVPRRLVGQSTRKGPVPRRLAPIFRDRDDLSASGDLSASVREALARSDTLIVICSPDAAQSRWVDQEVRAFRELNPEGDVLAAILSASPTRAFRAVRRVANASRPACAAPRAWWRNPSRRTSVVAATAGGWGCSNSSPACSTCGSTS